MAKKAVKEAGGRLPNVSYPTHLQSSREQELTEEAVDTLPGAAHPYFLIARTCGWFISI